MAIRIPIISDFDSKGVDKAVKQFEQLKTTGERAQFGLEKAALPAAAAIAGLAAVAVIATKAAIDDAAAQDQLAGVLERSTGATKEQVAATEEFISGLSRATATADDELRPALASLAQATGNLDKAQALLKVSQDLAASSGVDLATASDAVSKAVNGQMKGLQTLDPSLKGVIASGASFDKVMQQVAATTGGAAARAADTTAGRMKALQIRFSELQEEIGTKLLPVAEKLIGFLTNIIDVVSNNVGAVIFFGTAIGLLALAVIAANTAIKIHTAYLVLMKVAAAIATAVNTALAVSITAVQLATGVGIAVVIAATAALAIYVKKQKELQAELKATADAAGTANTALGGVIPLTFVFTQAQAKLTGASNAEARARLAGADAMQKYFDNMNKTTTATGTATQKTIEFAQAVKDGITAALDTAKTNLDSAKQAFATFADTVILGVKAGLSFADAYKLIDDNGKTFMENLKEQVDGIKKYAANLQTLLTRGLSQDALKYVLEAGGEAGAAIAAQLVAGTTEQITGPNGINALVESANQAANAVGLQAANNWYAAGVTQAQNIVNGLDQQLALLTPQLMKRMDLIASKLARTVDIAVRIKEYVTRAVGTPPSAVVNPLPGGSLAPPSITPGNPGGVQPSAMTINVMGGLATSADIGQAVVNAIRAYNRSAGPANIQVA